METMRLCIADVCVELSSAGKFSDRVRRDFRGFQTDQTPTLTIRLIEDRTAHTDIEPEARVHLTEDAFSIRRRGMLEVDFNERTGEGTIRHAGTMPHVAVGGVRAIVCVTLGRIDGLLLHASAIRFGGTGIAFLGISGAGKSTLCGMFPDADVLNDELIAVTDIGSQPIVHSTPFYGTLGTPRQQIALPLSICCGIEKGEPVELTDLTPSQALVLILRCATLPHGCTDLESRIFHKATQLARNLAWKVLRFSPRSAKEIADNFRCLISQTPSSYRPRAL